MNEQQIKLINDLKKDGFIIDRLGYNKFTYDYEIKTFISEQLEKSIFNFMILESDYNFYTGECKYLIAYSLDLKMSFNIPNFLKLLKGGLK